MHDSLIKVEGVSKKFCRSLKRSLWYGMQDLGREIAGRRHASSDALRKDEFWAVKDVSFELQRGECLGFIGHNGAGKTTLLRMLNGLIKPDQGRIEIRGRVGALIALGAGFNPILTGRENIYVNAAVLGLKKREIDEKIDEIIDFSEIGEFIDAPVQSYSSGMNVRLGFAVAIKTEPDIVLLDEVLAVGDVSFQAKCFNALSQFRERGTAFILVSHNMHQINRNADRVLYLDHGRMSFLGDTGIAVDRYIHNMEKLGDISGSEPIDWTKTLGSGKVVFNSASFIDNRGLIVEEINAGDEVTIAIAYECKDTIDNNPVLDVTVKGKDNLLYQGTNDSASQQYGKIPLSGTFYVKFRSLPANSDHVEFYFCLMDSVTREIYDWKRGVQLKVRRSTASSGILFVQTEWTVC
ncbi:MAG: ABC transporter ATP-binding protein [Candidatus Zixiibacteriota bacterium]|nr:MAG: ABC transporter ATP-binding protein [candidate division Zixibacteria bacterium]